MGQAKQRGTYQQRRAAAIKRAEAEQASRPPEPVALAGHRRGKSALPLQAIIAMAAGASGYRVKRNG